MIESLIELKQELYLNNINMYFLYGDNKETLEYIF
jgi:hypothetical protein